jgi:hypothetical protein
VRGRGGHDARAGRTQCAGGWAGPLREQAEKGGGGPLAQKMVFPFYFLEKIQMKIYLQF